MSQTSVATGETANALSGYPTPKLDPQPMRIQLDTSGVLRVYDTNGKLMGHLSGYYRAHINEVIDRWPNRAIALVELNTIESAPAILAWFVPVRVGSEHSGT